MQVTVSRVLAAILNNSVPIWAKEKNSRVSNKPWCISTLTTRYFRKGRIPIVRMAGTSVSSVSRGTNSRRKVGRKKASNTVAAAFIPGVSEKTSTASPKRMPTTSTHCGECPTQTSVSSRYTEMEWHILQYAHCSISAPATVPSLWTILFYADN